MNNREEKIILLIIELADSYQEKKVSFSGFVRRLDELINAIEKFFLIGMEE